MSTSRRVYEPSSKDDLAAFTKTSRQPQVISYVP